MLSGQSSPKTAIDRKEMGTTFKRKTLKTILVVWKEALGKGNLKPLSNSDV